jgi:hypothetical protein
VIAYPVIIVLVFKYQNRLQLQSSFIVFMVFKIVLLSVLTLFYYSPKIVNDIFIESILIDSKPEIMQFLIVMIVLIILNLFFKKYNQLSHLSFLNFVFSLSFFYFVGNAMQKPILEMAEKINDENLDIKVLNHYQPSLSFYSNRIIKMGEEKDAKFVFGKITDFNNQPATLIYSKSGFGLKKQ